jgi:hypothetical protein
MAHYRAYFGQEYAALKRRISRALTDVNGTHGGEAAAAFERAIRVAVERRQFWAQFCDVPEVTVDTAAFVRDWRQRAVPRGAQRKAGTGARDTGTVLGRDHVSSPSAVATLDEALKRANGAISLSRSRRRRKSNGHRGRPASFPTR